MKKILVFFLFIGVVFTLTSCGSESVNGKLTFAALDTSTGGTSSVHVNSDSCSTATHYTWARVDGVKVKVKSISLFSDDSMETVWSDSDGKTVTLTPNGGNIEFDIEVPVGTYTGTSVTLDSSYDVKAWACVCDGANYDIYYTSSTGIKKIEDESTCTKPTASDYDYYHYEFLYVTTAESPDSTTDEANESGVAEFNTEITGGTTPNVQIVMDIYRLVTFWDGDTSNKIPPFSWGNNNNHDITEFFPNGQPNFGISYIPIFMSLDDTGTTLGRVYIFSEDETKVDNFDENNPDSTLSYFVIATKSNGEYLGSRIVGFDNTDLDQFNSEYNKSGDLASFYNGEHCPDADEYEQQCDSTGRFLKNLKIEGFDMSKPAGEKFTMTVSNTEWCDDTVVEPGHADWGERMHCMSTSPKTFHVKRIR